MMNKLGRRSLSAALLLAAPAALANPPGPSPEATAREVMARTPAETPDLAEQVRTLQRNLEDLDTEVRRLRASEAQRPVLRDVGDPNDHPLWP